MYFTPLKYLKAKAFGDTEFKGFPEKGQTLLLWVIWLQREFTYSDKNLIMGASKKGGISKSVYDQPWWEFSCISYAQESLTVQFAKTSLSLRGEREGKAGMPGRGSRWPCVLPHPPRAGSLLWKNGRMITCSLRSFFPGSQLHYPQPSCPEEPSGDVNILLNSFLGKDRHKRGGVLVFLRHFMSWLQTGNVEL